MKYKRPEVEVLGDAARCIQGSKIPPPDAGSLTEVGTNLGELAD